MSAARRARVLSMTGFAEAAGEAAGLIWRWEVKSVNARGLELRFRLPAGLEGLEPALRGRLAKTLSRGSVFVSLTTRSASAAGRYFINQEALKRAIAAINEVRGVIECDPPRAEAILGLRGVLEADDPDLDDEEARAALLAGFDAALNALVAARAAEGDALRPALGAHLNEIAALSEKANDNSEEAVRALKTRLRQQIVDLAGAVADPDRLAQEAALLAVKADIREEIDRLRAHVASARDLLAAGSPMGRKLDFLIQELNREANTLCAKAATLTLKELGLALKSAIDQLREQTQNVE